MRKIFLTIIKDSPVIYYNGTIIQKEKTLVKQVSFLVSEEDSNDINKISNLLKRYTIK